MKENSRYLSLELLCQTVKPFEIWENTYSKYPLNVLIQD